jgi:hypothetical protein
MDTTYKSLSIILEHAWQPVPSNRPDISQFLSWLRLVGMSGWADSTTCTLQSSLMKSETHSQHLIRMTGNDFLGQEHSWSGTRPPSVPHWHPLRVSWTETSRFMPHLPDPFRISLLLQRFLKVLAISLLIRIANLLFTVSNSASIRQRASSFSSPNPHNKEFINSLANKDFLNQITLYKIAAFLDGRGSRLPPSRAMMDEFDRSQDGGIQPHPQSVPSIRMVLLLIFCLGLISQSANRRLQR